MKIVKKLMLPILISFLLFIGGPTVYAAPLSPLEASLVLQGTIPDDDFFLLTRFFGFQVGETLNYQSTSDLSGWSATLSGTYLGASLNVSYSGDISAFPAGAITWTSSGSYGSAAWSGSGSALITDTLMGFQVDFNSLLTVGSNSGLENVLIDATEDVSGTRFVGTSGTASVNGSPLLFPPFTKTYEFPTPLIFPPKVHSDIDFLGHPIIINEYFPTPVPLAAPFSIVGTIATVPEPSTYLLLVPGLLGLLGYAWRRRKSA